jgi:hypothetical protein
MSAFPGPANPIFYAQYHSRGGTRNTGIVCAVYALAIAGLIWATSDHTDPRRTADALQGWLVGLLGLQLLTLLMYGSLRVSTSVRGDINSKLIESHRLMPLPPAAAVVGYVLGAPIQALAVAAVNVVVGTVLCPMAGISVGNWLVANAMLLAFSLMMWVVTATMAMVSRGGFGLVALALTLSLFLGGRALDLLPGLAVLIAPLVGRTVFDLKGAAAGGADAAFAYACALVAQGLLAALFFSAAARKCRSSDMPAFNVSLGLMLLAAVVAISAAGTAFHDAFIIPYWRTDNSEERTRFVASVIVAMLLMILPLAASARARTDWTRQGPTPSQRRRPAATLLVMAAAVGLVCILLRVHPTHMPSAAPTPMRPVRVPIKRGNVTSYIYQMPTVIEPRLGDAAQMTAMLQTAGVVLTFAAAAAMLLTWAYRRRWRAWLIVLIWLAIVGVVPLIADVVQRSAASSNNSGDGFGMLATLSPIGALSTAWDGHAPLATLGVAFGAGFLVLPAGLLLLTGRGRQPKVDGPVPQIKFSAS